MLPSMNWSELRKAVSDSEEPTPGYLYNTLSQWTYTDRKSQNELLAALFSKLEPSTMGAPTSVHVLFKVLHLIKVLCEVGHPDFARSVRAMERSSTIKAYTSFHGPQDPVHGDALNNRVRQEAKAALEAAFHDRASPYSSGGDGYGGAQTASASSSASAERMLGHGNSEFRTDTALRMGEGPFAGDPSGLPGMGSSGRIGELPQENRWMEYLRELDARRATQPANTLLEQLSHKAKAGWKFIKEHEQLRLTEDRAYNASSARRRLPEKEMERIGASGYQPVGVPAAHPSTEGNGEHDNEDESTPQRGDGWRGAAVDSGTSASRFGFLDAPVVPLPAAVAVDGGPAGSRDSLGALLESVPTAGEGEEERGSQGRGGSPSPSPPSPQQQQQQQQLLPFRRTVQRLVSAKAVPPQRVDTMKFVAACMAEGQQRTAKAAPQRMYDGDFGFQRETNVVDGPASLRAEPSPAERDEAAVWTQLGDAINEQLALQLPWQHRLNALCGLEALLLRVEDKDRRMSATAATTASATDSLFGISDSPLPASEQQRPSSSSCGEALMRYFAERPHNIRRNTLVAQLTLRERCARVASLLHISTSAAADGGPEAEGRAASASPPLLLQQSDDDAQSSVLSLEGLTIGGSRHHQQRQQQRYESKASFGFSGSSSSDRPPQALKADAAAPHAPSLFAAAGDTTMKPRRRAPTGSVRSEVAPCGPATATASPAATTASAEAHGSAFDSLWVDPRAAPITSAPQPPHQPPSVLDDLFAQPAPAPAATQQQPRQRPSAKPAIVVLGVSSHADPLAGSSEQPEGSPHFNMGGVASGGPAPGSIQSMNRALAELQRKLVSGEQP